MSHKIETPYGFHYVANAFSKSVEKGNIVYGRKGQSLPLASLIASGNIRIKAILKAASQYISGEPIRKHDLKLYISPRTSAKVKIPHARFRA